MNHEHFTEQVTIYATNKRIYNNLLGIYNKRPFPLDYFHEEMAFINEEVKLGHFQHGSKDHGDMLEIINKDLIHSIKLEKDAKRVSTIKNIVSVSYTHLTLPTTPYV